VITQKGSKGEQNKNVVNRTGLKELTVGINWICFQFIVFCCSAYKRHLPSMARWTQTFDCAY